MASSDEYLSDLDEDMISCHICLMRFNTTDRKPKYLDCHHYFCFDCIKGFSNVNNVACPTCRNLTNLLGRQVKDLATNNMALRFATRIATNHVREYAEQGKKQKNNSITQNYSSVAVLDPLGKCYKMWCTQCSVFGTALCVQKHHMMLDPIKVLSDNMEEVEAKVSECFSMWDTAIKVRQRVRQYYDDVLKSLQLVQNELMNRIEVNDSNIALMESRKQVAQDLCLPSIVENTEEDVTRAILKTKYAIERLTMGYGLLKDGNRCLLVSRQLYQNLATVEENCIDVSFSNADPTKCALQMDLLKKLRLSFNEAKHPEPVVKACLPVLSFVILKLAEEQSKQTNGHVNFNQVKTVGQVNGTSNGQIYVYASEEQRSAQLIEYSRYVQANRIENDFTTKPTVVSPVKHQSSIGNIANPYDSSVPTGSTSFRDSLFKTPAVKTTNEWQVVTTSPRPEVKSLVNGGGGGNSGNRCYFRMFINGTMSENIIVQLDQVRAPIMCAKFKEMCTIEKGYQGSKIFKSYKDDSVVGSSGWFHTYTLEERRDLFVADKCNLAENRGSVRFMVKKAEKGIAQLSTEFIVSLSNRPPHFGSTSVFGQVIEGLEVFDKISRMSPKSNVIKFAKCGVC